MRTPILVGTIRDHLQLSLSCMLIITVFYFCRCLSDAKLLPYFVNGGHQFFYFGRKSGKISFFKKLFGKKVGAYTNTSHSVTEPANAFRIGGSYYAGVHHVVLGHVTLNTLYKVSVSDF